MSPEQAGLFSLFGAGVILTFVIGFYGLLTTRNLIRALIALEILTKGVTLLLVLCGYAASQVALAQALAITLIIIEVAVIVVAVGIVLCVYRTNNSLDTDSVKNLKG